MNLKSKNEVGSNYYIELCKNIASKVGLSSDEVNTIFDFKIEEPETMAPTSMRLVVEEERPITFQEKSQTLEILGDNQSGKTFTLLYLSNLLGYNFFDKENEKFLADENVVKQGQEVFRRLKTGVKARLEVVGESDILSVSAKEGQAEVVMSHNKKRVYKNRFDLKTQSNAFRDYLRRFADVQFVSKGRNFDGQLLIDISVQLRKYLERVQKKTGSLIVAYTDGLDELAAGRTIDELHTAKTVIGGEINKLNATLAERATSIGDLQSKLSLIEEVFGKLAKLEKTKVFKTRRSIVQLQEKLPSAEKQQLADQLENIESELSTKKRTYDAVEGEFANAITRIKQRSDEFSQKDRLVSLLSILRDRDIDLLTEERERYDSSTYAVVQEIHDKIKDYDKTISLPQELGGSVESLQANAEKAKEEVQDHGLIKSLTGPLITSTNKHQITSSTLHRALKDEVEKLQEEESKIKEEIAEVTLSASQLKKMQRKLESLKQEFAGLDQTDKNKIAELETPLQTFEELSSIVYSPNWKEGLLKSKLALEEELEEDKEKQDRINQRIEESRKRLLEISGILSRPELTTYSEGVDRLNKFNAILATLAKILERKENLINRELARDEFDYLDQYGIPPLLDDTINKIFLSRCKYYFNITEENKCQVFEIGSFDYRNKQFSLDDVQKSVIDLSGGTASIMTVLSLATRTTDSIFGKVLLIDEFHDVAGVLRRETYRLLQPIKGLSFVFFAKPVDGLELTVRRAEVAN